MKNKTSLLPLRLAPRAAGFVLATVLPLAVSSIASAFELNFGAVTGSLDTTLSYGTGWRLEDPDTGLAARMSYPALVADHHGTFINKNDGDGNFDNNSKPISNVFKITSDIELKYDKYGFYASGTAFYDTTIMDRTPNRASPNLYPNSSSCNPQTTSNPSACGFPSAIDDNSGRSGRVLAAYVYGNFDISGHALNVRAGEQVLSWGEALFLQNGINSANPVSLSALRLPGAAVKEALLPLPMLSASLGLTDNLTAEAFYEFDWGYSKPDDVGTFYSGDDAFAGQGADRILVDLDGSALGAPTAGPGSPSVAQLYNLNKYGVASNILTNKHIPDIDARRDNQYGLAFRYSLDKTELGIFFMNTNSHIPVAQAMTGQANGALVAGSAACKTASQLLSGNPAAPCITSLNATALSGGLGAPAQQAVGGVNAANYIDTTSYQLLYPNDIHMIGLSFSSAVGDFSFSGELAYRPNDVILAELGDNLVAYNALNAATLGNGGTATAGTVLNNGQPIKAGQIVKDWVQLETYNLDLVSIYNFGPMLGSDGMTGVVEYGASYIPQGEDHRYASTASLLNLQGAQYAATQPEGPSDNYLDKLSMGYRLVLTSTYNDVFAGVSLSPTIRFAHDFSGNSQRTGNFQEGRKSATVGMSALYNQAFEVAVAYNTFWGAGNSNLLADRDNVTASLKYSF
jgi:hypothetical protein